MVDKLELLDDRPLVEPTLFSSSPLPASDQEARAWFKDAAHRLSEIGATQMRMTFFNDEHPSDIYPHGLYAEGWELPSGTFRQAPFNFPLTDGADPKSLGEADRG